MEYLYYSGIVGNNSANCCNNVNHGNNVNIALSNSTNPGSGNNIIQHSALNSVKSVDLRSLGCFGSARCAKILGIIASGSGTHARCMENVMVNVNNCSIGDGCNENLNDNSIGNSNNINISDTKSTIRTNTPGFTSVDTSPFIARYPNDRDDNNTDINSNNNTCRNSSSSSAFVTPIKLTSLLTCNNVAFSNNINNKTNTNTNNNSNLSSYCFSSPSSPSRVTENLKANKNNNNNNNGIEINSSSSCCVKSFVKNSHFSPFNNILPIVNLNSLNNGNSGNNNNLMSIHTLYVAVGTENDSVYVLRFDCLEQEENNCGRNSAVNNFIVNSRNDGINTNNSRWKSSYISKLFNHNNNNNSNNGIKISNYTVNNNNNNNDNFIKSINGNNSSNHTFIVDNIFVSLVSVLKGHMSPVTSISVLPISTFIYNSNNNNDVLNYYGSGNNGSCDGDVKFDAIRSFSATSSCNLSELEGNFSGNSINNSVNINVGNLNNNFIRGSGTFSRVHSGVDKNNGIPSCRGSVSTNNVTHNFLFFPLQRDGSLRTNHSRDCNNIYNNNNNKREDKKEKARKNQRRGGNREDVIITGDNVEYRDDNSSNCNNKNIGKTYGNVPLLHVIPDKDSTPLMPFVIVTQACDKTIRFWLCEAGILGSPINPSNNIIDKTYLNCRPFGYRTSSSSSNNNNVRQSCRSGSCCTNNYCSSNGNCSNNSAKAVIKSDASTAPVIINEGSLREEKGKEEEEEKEEGVIAMLPNFLVINTEPIHVRNTPSQLIITHNSAGVAGHHLVVFLTPEDKAYIFDSEVSNWCRPDLMLYGNTYNNLVDKNIVNINTAHSNNNNGSNVTIISGNGN